MNQTQLFPDPVPGPWTPDQKLMALSWKQPYADLMLHQKIETRTWSTKYRGWVLICASKKGYQHHEILNISGNQQTVRIINTVLNQTKIYWGYAIAVGYLSDCRPMTPEDEEAAFVLYRPELWCHVYDSVRAIAPLPWTGTQGWKEVGPEFKNQIKFLEP